MSSIWPCCSACRAMPISWRCWQSNYSKEANCVPLSLQVWVHQSRWTTICSLQHLYPCWCPLKALYCSCAPSNVHLPDKHLILYTSVIIGSIQSSSFSSNFRQHHDLVTVIFFFLWSWHNIIISSNTQHYGLEFQVWPAFKLALCVTVQPVSEVGRRKMHYHTCAEGVAN